MQITETDIATFLLDTPDFFDRHAELLSEIQLISPHGKRAVSLQERQIELQRDKTKALELKLAEMVRYAQENDAIQGKLQRWVRTLLLHRDNNSLPTVLLRELKAQFAMPQAALKLWHVEPSYAELAWAQGASADVASFTGSLMQPYCGVNSGFEAVTWMEDAGSVKSVALIALRPLASSESGNLPACFGLLALGSPDADRFKPQMGTDFLQRIGELTSAACSRLIQAA
jgi:uncharacterized protein